MDDFQYTVRVAGLPSIATDKLRIRDIREVFTKDFFSRPSDYSIDTFTKKYLLEAFKYINADTIPDYILATVLDGEPL